MHFVLKGLKSFYEYGHRNSLNPHSRDDVHTGKPTEQGRSLFPEISLFLQMIPIISLSGGWEWRGGEEVPRNGVHFSKRKSNR